MVQPDANSNGDTIIDIVEVVVGAGPGDCPVCMEPAEWVTVGPCGHREVCITCAVRMRFVERNWQCCICWAFCPTVVITKQTTAAAAAGQQQEGAAFPKPPLAAGGGGRSGTPLLYHSGMATYFDDQGLYEKATKMCLEESARSAGVGVNGHAPQNSPRFLMILFLIQLVVNTLIGCGVMGVPISIHFFRSWHQRIPFVLACGFLTGVASSIVWKLCGSSNSNA